jgi:hypothetical protein
MLLVVAVQLGFMTAELSVPLAALMDTETVAAHLDLERLVMFFILVGQVAQEQTLLLAVAAVVVLVALTETDLAAVQTAA